MSNSADIHPDNADIFSDIIEALHQAKKPLTLPEINALFPVSKRSGLSSATLSFVREGKIFKWPAARGGACYWSVTPENYCREKIIKILSDKNLTRAALDKKLAGQMFGHSLNHIKTLRIKILNQLIREKQIFEHPPVGFHGKVSIFGTRMADPRLYFSNVKKEFETICKKLRKTGIPNEMIYKAAREVLMPDEENAQTRAAKPSIAKICDQSPETCAKQVLEAIIRVEPAALQQVLVSTNSLRLAAGLTKEIFDRTIIYLARQEKLFLHEHACPDAMTDEDRNLLVKDDQGNYFMGVVLRKGA
ncbi:hypothetical protein QUF76_14140 [Desulfobacterales bacterium HSG16]|nr:hypothetical protein [Desulfobacterales bacterium HSG16]